MLASGKQTLKYFNKLDNTNQETNYQLKTDAEFMKENNIAQLPPYREYFKYDKMEDIIMFYEYKTGLTTEELEHERNQRRAFIHMLQQMLKWDPDQRWTPAQLLTHPLITGQPFTGDYTPPATRPQRIITRTPAQPQHPNVIVSSHTNPYNPANMQQPAQSYFDQLSPTGPSYMNPQYIYGQGAILQPPQQYTQQLGTSPSVNAMLKRQVEDRYAPNTKTKNNSNTPRKNSHQPSANNKQAQQRRNRSYSQSGSEYSPTTGNSSGQSTHHSQRQGRSQAHNQQHREYNNNNQTRGRANTMVHNTNNGAQHNVNINQPPKKLMTPPQRSHRNRSNSSPPTPIEVTNAMPNQGKPTTYNTPHRPAQHQRQTYSIRVPRQKFASDDHGGTSRSWEKSSSSSMMTSPPSGHHQYSPVKSSVPLVTAVDPSPRIKERESRDEVMKDSNINDQNTLPESAAHVNESPQSPVIPQSPQYDMMELSKPTLMDRVIEEDDSVFSSESDTMVDPSPRDAMISEQTTSSDWAWDPTYSDEQLLSSDQSAVMMGQSPPTNQCFTTQQYHQYAMQQGNAMPSHSFLGMSPYDRGMYYPPQNYNAQFNLNYSQQRGYYPPKHNK